MRALRILHVAPYYDQAWAYGGIPRLATTMTRALARRGHHVTVCTTDARDRDSRVEPHDSTAGGVAVHVFPNVSNTLAYRLQLFTPVGLAGFLRRQARAFDVAHIHACHNLPAVIAAAALRRAGVPYVVQPNGTALPIERRILAKRVFARTIGRRLLGDARRVVAVSQAERHQLHTLGIDDARIAVVANPVDLSEFESVPDPGQFRARIGAPNGRLILFLGKLTPRKGVEDLVRALPHVRECGAMLAIAGNDMGTGGAIARLAHRLALERRVVLTGLLTASDRLAALAAADVVVYPSRDEVFGLVPLEALSCGTAVVVCDDSGCGEIITRIGGGITVRYGDYRSLALAIDRILADPAEWRARARTAADSIRRLYGSETVADQLEQLYDEVLTPRGTHSVARNSGVSFVVPVLNGRRTLRASLAGILAQRDGRPFEVIAVDDGSTDGSRRLLEEWQTAGVLTLLHGGGQGAAAAINAGFRAAVHPILCQVDQDVILQSGWLRELLPVFDDPDVAAAQGHYMTKEGAGLWARAMGRDLEHRYSQIDGDDVDHVCTGNSAYRASAIRQVGLLDERLGYGYDNDLSYRLVARGYRLAFRRRAISVPVWREGFIPYLRQQFGVGYGRLDVVARHPRKALGDDVSGVVMMAHGPVMLLAIAALTASGVLAAVGLPWRVASGGGLLLVALLAIERACAGLVAWRRSGDPAALTFVVAHLARDVAWAHAIALWAARRLFRRTGLPSHSMHRPDTPAEERHSARRPSKGEVLAVVPAFNEAASLQRVVADLSRVLPREDILVVNDGSTDETDRVLPGLGVRWLTLSQRLGVGGAVRAGIRYARREGYAYVVRIDGDGQHRACDIARLYRAVVGGADAAIGSRFLHRLPRAGWRRATQAMLAACLTVVSGRRVTDPTSGFWLFGPRALRLLCGHHPGGYAEPELVLFLRRNGVRLVEVPIRMRPRSAGRTSLTTTRAIAAVARTLLAIVVVPLRQLAEGTGHD
jgi:glycosyltransferase involved in cell wall biosynthesis